MVSSRLVAMAMTLLVLASCDAALPSLKLVFDVHRPSMAVRGASAFDIFVTPVVSGDSVQFNGKLSVKQDGATHNFLLVDSVPYHEVIDGSASITTCQSTEFIPGVSDVVNAIASATAVASVSTNQAISCTDGTWLSTTLDGESYVVCSKPDDVNFTVYGADLSVSLEYLTENVEVNKPLNSPSDCAAVKDGSVALSALEKIYGKALSGSQRRLKEEVKTASLSSAKCSCQSKPRPCLFFHGMDVEKDGGIIDDYPFFGKIKQHAPCCSSFSFAILNTVDYEWYNETLLEKACNAALNVSTGSTDSESTVINNLIVVAHSMGNNMFASALASGMCSIGRNVDWVDLSGPMKGSMGSDFIHDICDGGEDGSPDILSKFGGLIGQCPGSTTRRSLVYYGGSIAIRRCRLGTRRH